MKFYDLKVQGVPQVIFMLLLAVSFGVIVFLQPYAFELSMYLQQVMVSLQDAYSNDIFTNPAAMERLTEVIFSPEYAQLLSLMLKIFGFIILQQALMMLLNFFYLGSYMVDLESAHPTFSQYIKKYLLALPRYIVFNILFYICVGIAFLIVMVISSLVSMFLPVIALVLPLLPIGWFVIQVFYIFKDVIILDTGVGVFHNFNVSLRLSSGNRMMIGRNIFFIVFLKWIIISIFATGNGLITLFILSFLEVIVILVEQRLIALMYMARTRVAKAAEKDELSEIDR